MLIGWFTHNDLLRAFVAGKVTMKFNTALCFVLSSLVLLINYFSNHKDKQHILSAILSVVVSLIGLLTIAEFVFGINIGIDELFVNDELNTTATYYAGRMSPFTAVNFIFIGTGLLLLNKEKTATYQFFYLSGVSVMALLMLIGFNFIAAIPTYIYFGIHTAIGFIVLAGGIWLSQPVLHNKISFYRKLSTSFGAIIMLIALLSIFSSYYSNKRISTANLVRHTNDVLSESRQILSLVKDIESGGRGYLLTNDSAYLEYFLVAKNDVFNHTTKLRQLTNDNISQQSKIDSLVAAVEKRIGFSEKMISARNEEGFAAANALMATHQGTFYTAEIRELTSAIEREETRLLTQRQKENSDSIVSFNRAFVVFIICVFLLITIILFSIRNYIAVGKKAEALLSKQNEELELRVKERIAEIEKNEGRFRAIIENNYDIIKLLDENLTVFYRSPSASRVTGWTDEELMGLSILHNIHPDDSKKTNAILQKLRRSSGKSVNITFRNQHKDGHYLWIEGSVTNLLHDEHVNALVFNFRDVTERIDAEQKLVSSEERFRSIIEQYPSPVIRYEPDGKYISANPAWEIMWQDKLENIIDYNIRKDPNMKASGMSAIIEKAFAGETVMTDVYEYDPSLIGKKGRKRWIQLLMYPLKDNGGNLLEVVLITLDMTDNKEAEEKLVASEKRYRYLFESNPLPMWVIDLKTFKFLDVNKMAILQYGYSRQEFLSMTAKDIRPPEDVDRFVQSDHSFKTDDSNYNKGIWKHRKKDGSIIDVEIIAHEILFEGTEARFVLAHDVTEQKKAEEKIIASEKQFRNTLDNMLEGAQIVDFNWRYIYINDSLAKHAKYKREEMIGYTVMEKFPGIEQTAIYKVYQRCFNERVSIHLENEFTFPDGSVGWFELSFQPIPEGIFILSIDITERKRAEAAILSAEANYREIFEKASDAIYVLEIETGKAFEINRRATEITGYSKQELFKRDPNLLMTGDPNYTRVQSQAYMEKAANGEPQQFDWLIKKADGTHSWIEVNLTKANIAGKERILSFFREINDRKKAQLEVQKLNEELEQKVVTRTEQLRKINEELEAFSYSVSHDLRAPLRAIIGFSAILQEDYISNLDEEAKRITAVIIDNTRKMGQLIDDLLTFSRMGRQEVLKTRIDTAEMVKEIVEETDKKDSNAKKINWLIQELPPVMGDINIFRQVWINLISNAAKYSAKSSIQQIEVGSFTRDGETVFFVKDNGVGFDAKYKHKLFRVFQRLHSADEFEGTGIGLAIVEKIISKHGGKVWAEGEKDKGACFYFSLPAA